MAIISRVISLINPESRCKDVSFFCSLGHHEDGCLVVALRVREGVRVLEVCIGASGDGRCRIYLEPAELVGIKEVASFIMAVLV